MRVRARQARRRVAGRLPKPLLSHPPVDHAEPATVRSRRRRVVAGACLVGTGLLGVSLASRPGSRRFYASSLAAAGTWAVAGALSGPVHRGWIAGRDEQLRRPLATPVATGVGAFGFFYASAVVCRRVPLLSRALTQVLRFANEGGRPAVLLAVCANGIAEEVFFRGALYAAVEHRHPVATSTAVYTAATVATRNPALVVAAAVMGTLLALQRRASGGIQASVLTHLTWSVLMVVYLPALFETDPDREASRATARHDTEETHS